MKTKQWIGTLAAFLLILSGCTSNNRGVVECPAFIARSTDGLEIGKVVLSDTATVLYMKAFYPPGELIGIDSNSFLTDNLGKQYNILSTEGISMDEEFYMPESGEAEFAMIFPPVASNAVYVNFSESVGDEWNLWKIWGIQLTNKPLKALLPKGFKAAAIDKNAILPPVEFKAGKARLEGEILNFCPGMSAGVAVWVAYPFKDSPRMTLPVDEKGKFSVEIDAFSVHPVRLYWSDYDVQCFIAAGETTSIIFNPAEKSRQNSRLLSDKPSLGEPVYYGGYLASLSKELTDVQSMFSLQYYNDYGGWMSFIKNIEAKTPETLKDFFLDGYQLKKAELEALDLSPACKQILLCTTDLAYTHHILSITSQIDIAYIYNNQLQNDKEAADKYYAARKFNLPDDFYNIVKDFSLINDPQILYSQYANIFAFQQEDINFSKLLGTDQGIIFDLMKVNGIYADITNFKPVDETQIKQLPADFQKFIRMKNEELLQLLEANKNKTVFTENDIQKVADEDIFPFILSKFKGKPILLDFWETWCGPCRSANEELKPVKAELADKDIVYVYVATERSPLETWENMIPDLHGEHFRLSEKQWDYVKSTFNIGGVPTYFYIDREGNIKEKETGFYGTQQIKEKLLQLLDE
jgi:thiol-disulfide isomerase/thioredoxin